MKLPARKIVLLLVFIGMLWDSLFAPTGSNPGRAGAFVLTWAIGARQFLPTPSYTLTIFATFCATLCLAWNHGLLAGPVLVPRLSFALLSGLLIMWCEKIANLFRTQHKHNKEGLP